MRPHDRGVVMCSRTSTLGTLGLRHRKRACHLRTLGLRLHGRANGQGCPLPLEGCRVDGLDQQIQFGVDIGSAEKHERKPAAVRSHFALRFATRKTTKPCSRKCSVKLLASSAAGVTYFKSRQMCGPILIRLGTRRGSVIHCLMAVVLTEGGTSLLAVARYRPMQTNSPDASRPWLANIAGCHCPQRRQPNMITS